MCAVLQGGGGLPEHFEYLNFKIKEDYNRYFSRIVDNRVCVYNASGGREIIESAWIDIFPLDGNPNIPFSRYLHYTSLMWTRLRYHLSCFDYLVNLNRPGISARDGRGQAGSFSKMRVLCFTHFRGTSFPLRGNDRSGIMG